MSEVGVAEFRRELKTWLRRVEDGDEVIVTDRGRPVARLVAATGASKLDELVQAGTLSVPTGRRVQAIGQPRITSRGPGSPRSVSEAVVDERDARR